MRLGVIRRASGDNLPVTNWAWVTPRSLAAARCTADLSSGAGGRACLTRLLGHRQEPWRPVVGQHLRCGLASGPDVR